MRSSKSSLDEPILTSSRSATSLGPSELCSSPPLALNRSSRSLEFAKTDPAKPAHPQLPHQNNSLRLNCNCRLSFTCTD